MPKLERSASKQTLQGKQKMTAERLCSFKGFENYTNSEANTIIEQLERLAQIVCNHVQNTN